MKNTNIFGATVLITVVLLIFASCNKTVYVPIESVKTEYKERLQRDSIHLYDSIFVKVANDTVWLEKYKYAYRDKLIRDSIFVNDTIRVPYPVVEYKEVNKVKSWQHFLIWCGIILLVILFGKTAFKLIKSKI